jgi:hypothetical protein
MGAVLPAVALYIFVSIFSDGAESSSRWKILLIAIGSGFVSAMVRELIQGVVGALVGLVLALALIAGGLVFWCKVDRKAALKIAGSYFVFSVILAIVVTYLTGVVAAS